MSTTAQPEDPAIESITWHLIEFSPTRAKIAAALVDARGKMGVIVNSETAHVKSEKANYSYTYADLGGVLQAVGPALQSSGIIPIQAPAIFYESSGVRVVVETMLLHTSGEFARSKIEMRPSAAKPTPQECGSTITYARRYAMNAMCAVASQDDDGAGGSRERAVEEANERAEQARVQTQKREDEKHASNLERVEALIAKYTERGMPETVPGIRVRELTDEAVTDWRELRGDELYAFYTAVKAWRPATASQEAEKPAQDASKAARAASDTPGAATTPPAADSTPKTAASTTPDPEAEGEMEKHARLTWAASRLQKLGIPDEDDALQAIVADASAKCDGATTYDWHALSPRALRAVFVELDDRAKAKAGAA